MAELSLGRTEKLGSAPAFRDPLTQRDLELLQRQIDELVEELEQRERRDAAMRKNLERAANALLSAANVEKKAKGRLPK